MSLSNQENGGQAWGTIYSQGREHSLHNLEHSRSSAWTPADEEHYLARVRERAGQMATKLLADARREAENIRRTAREEGYAEGLEHSRAELEEFRSGMGEAVSAVLGAIEGQCSNVFQQWREDIIALARLCVEKVTSVELSENRRAMLESLLTESVAILEKRRQLVIRVNPEDEAMLSDIVGLAQEHFPDVNVWRVKADSGISPGGMVVESESSLAEGRVESRIAAVQGILDNLVLNDGTLPEESFAAPVPETGLSPAPAQSQARTHAQNHSQNQTQDQPQAHAPAAPGQPKAEASAPAKNTDEAGAGAPEADMRTHELPAPEASQAPMPQTTAQKAASAANAATGAPAQGHSQEPAPTPPDLPGIDLNNPNLSQEDINAALDAMLAGNGPDNNS